MKLNKYTFVVIFGLVSLMNISCAQQNIKNTVKTEITNPMPFSDQQNEGGWVLNEDLSDEFKGTEIAERNSVCHKTSENNKYINSKLQWNRKLMLNMMRRLYTLGRNLSQKKKKNLIKKLQMPLQN